MGKLYNRAEIYDLLEDDNRYSWNLRHWQKLFADKEIHTMLDVSIGSGSMTLPVLELGIELSGSDLSENMLQRCQQKAKNKGHSIYTITSDFREVSSRFQEKFDCVASSGNSLAYVSNEDVMKTLHEMDKLVKPGGYLYMDSRNWERILRDRQRFYLYNPVFHGETRINLVQAWDYPEDGSIVFNLLFTFEKDNKIFQKEIFEEHYHPISHDLILNTIAEMGYQNITMSPYPAIAPDRPFEEMEWYTVMAQKHV